MKVLLLDDDKYFCEDFATLLEMEDVTCDIKNSADDLLEIIDCLNSYKIIFLDIMLRKGSKQDVNNSLETGEILYKLIRDKYPNKKIVIISAKNKEDIKIKIDNILTKYIQKPLSSGINEVFSILKEDFF
ncbi:hypothetical protein [Marinobacterium sp. BA1]|uniref:hypothetical protein n=1 Tax=Marinobacterium sp. BA1 TaxID=3138931 RepID=UPI0032E6EBE2